MFQVALRLVENVGELRSVGRQAEHTGRLIPRLGVLVGSVCVVRDTEAGIPAVHCGKGAVSEVAAADDGVDPPGAVGVPLGDRKELFALLSNCLLYTSPSPRDS